jgi:hypothetical protein
MSDFLTALYGLTTGIESAVEKHETKKKEAREAAERRAIFKEEIRQKELDRKQAMAQFIEKMTNESILVGIQQAAEKREAELGTVLLEKAKTELEAFRRDQVEQPYVDPSTGETYSLLPEEIRQLNVQRLMGGLPRPSAEVEEDLERQKEAASNVFQRLYSDALAVGSPGPTGLPQPGVISPEQEANIIRVVENMFPDLQAIGHFQGLRRSSPEHIRQVGLRLPLLNPALPMREPFDAFSPVYRELLERERRRSRAGLAGVPGAAAALLEGSGR